MSLAELLVVLAVSSVLMAVAVPAFGAMRERLAALAAFHALTAALAETRIAAVKHGRPVTICPSADGATCRADLVWDTGWLVYLDPGRNAQPLRPEHVLWVEQRARDGIAIRGTPGRHRVRYQPTGMSGGNNASLRICSRRENRHLGSVIVSLAGRTRVARAANEDRAPCPYVP